MNKQKSFVSNVMLILAAQMIVKILGLLYRMVITNIKGFGDAGNGYYSAGFQIYTLLLALSSVGIPNAIAKFISEKNTLCDYKGAKMLLKTALILFSVFGIILSAGLFFLSEPIAETVLNMEGAKYTLAALSPSIFFVCVSSVLRGYFSGMNKMQIMSASQIIEQAFKSVLTILFVLLSVGMRAEYMSAFANLATTAATVFGTIYLLYAYKRSKNAIFTNEKVNIKSNFVSVAKKILMIAVPISLCSVISAINRIADTATITRGIEEAFENCIPARIGAAAVFNPTRLQLNNEAVRLSGMLAKSDTLINLPLALNIALATVLVPSISKCGAENNGFMIKKYVHSSVLTSFVLILPCAAGYIVLAKPIYNLIYPNASLGFELLQLSSLSLIFTALNQTIMGALQGMGKVYVPTLALAFGCVVKLISNVLLIRIPAVNIYGAVIGSVLCQMFVFAIQSVYLSKSLPGKTKIGKMITKPFICTLIMSVGTYFIYKASFHLLNSNLISIVISVLLSVGIYGAGILLLKVFSYEELAKLPIFGFFVKKHIRNIKNVIK